MRKKSAVYYDCFTKLGPEDPGFSSSVEFVPTKASLDVNAAAIDIIRCVLDVSESDVRVLLALNRSSALKVELVTKTLRKSILEFTVPWEKRQAGTFELPTHSRWEASWSKFYGDRSYHLVLPGLAMAESVPMLRLVKETVRHHLKVGFTRVYMSTSLSPSSEGYLRIARAMSAEVTNGSFVLASYSAMLDSPMATFLPDVRSVSRRAFFNLLFDNMCLYLVKGTARFLGVWDLDELLVPHFPLSGIDEIVRRSFLAAGRQSKYCALVFSSAVILRKQALSFSEARWIGEAFNTSALRGHAAGGLDYKKSIIPTWRVFHSGFHLPGACKLPLRFTSCESRLSNEPCISGITDSWSEFTRKCKERKPAPHNFNDMVCAENMKVVDRSLAEIYHVQIHRPRLKNPAQYDGGATNEYSLRYFPNLDLS